MIFFILGSHPDISIAEIKQVIKDQNQIYNELHRSDSVLVIDQIDVNLGQLQETLAGTIKVGRIIGEMNVFDLTGTTDLIGSYASGAMGKNKISFGLSVYDLGGKHKTRDIVDEIDDIGSSVKKYLKETGRPVRYVSSKEPILSSVIVEQNGLLISGGEYVFLVSDEKILICQTEAVQNFKSWSDRDYGRPARDSKSGMLPPKLARMMVNLAGTVESKTILDPFCGSGTILMEAMLLGADKIIGSDISEKATNDTAKNITWIVDRRNLEAPKFALHTTDAKELDTFISKQVDLMVAETYLGPARKNTVSEKEIKRSTR